MIADSLPFRPAEASDVPALHRLIERAYRGEDARAGWTHEADLLETPRTSAGALAALIEDPDELLLVFLQGAAFVGCVQLTRLPADATYLGLLAVDPQRQASGLGRRIIATAEAEARRHFGSRTMELTVVAQRSDLIAYYERRGYARTGERRPFPIPVVPPLTLVVLRKPLGEEAG